MQAQKIKDYQIIDLTDLMPKRERFLTILALGILFGFAYWKPILIIPFIFAWLETIKVRILDYA